MAPSSDIPVAISHIMPTGKASASIVTPIVSLRASGLQQDKIAAIYARVSTTDQADKGYSLPVQIEACQRLAQHHGYTVPEHYIFVDDYTGKSLNRPQFTLLREVISEG